MFSFTVAAVRFGRIPKREKQRMLLEMQNAMNNMMSNNSQLHSMLQGHQSPLPLEPSPSPSSSSSSASDSSSSCSNPSSPQCPPDSESVVSMDTNSSSASSCSSDSGEDEAVHTSNRQPQDAFTYHQQRSPVRSQRPGSPGPIAVETTCDRSVEEQQDSWNCWTNTRGYQHSQQVSNTAYREEQAYQQLHSAPSFEAAHDSPQQLHTHNPASSRTHLVSV